MFVVVTCVIVDDARCVFRGDTPPTASFLFLFFPSSLRGVSAIRTVFLIQTELVSSLHFQVAASRRGKSEFDQEIEIVSSFLLG